MNIAYRFRIYPTEEQKILLGKTFGCCRFLYNQMLNDKIQEYEKTKKMLKNTPAMYKKEYPFLKEVDSLSVSGQADNKKICPYPGKRIAGHARIACRYLAQ